MWIESPMGYLKLDKAGNIIKRHPHKYYAAGDKTIRVDLDANGKEIKSEFYGQRYFIYVLQDGTIVGEGGAKFNLSIELDGPEAQSVEFQGQKAIAIEIPAHDRCPTCGQVNNWPIEKIRPADLVGKVRHPDGSINESAFRYKWDFTKKTFIKLPGAVD